MPSAARSLAWSVLCCAALAVPAFAQQLGNSFSYNGQLQNLGLPANGPHDMSFRLFDASGGGSQVGPTQCRDNVNVYDGYFSVTLNFGAEFYGLKRYLEISVRADTGSTCADGTGFTTLAPRQELAAVPYSLFSLNSGKLEGQPAAFYRNASNLNDGILPDARLQGRYNSPLDLANTANSFAGVGTGLKLLNATNLSMGVLGSDRLSGRYAKPLRLDNPRNGFIGSFSGTGAGLFFLNASAMTFGTVPDARLSANVAMRNAESNTFAGDLAVLGNAGFGTAAGNARLTVAQPPGGGISLFGQSGSNHAIWGETTAGGQFAGVVGKTTSNQGAGVYGTGPYVAVVGEATATNGVGLRGSAQGFDSIGVYGDSDIGSGVQGQGYTGVECHGDNTGLSAFGPTAIFASGAVGLVANATNVGVQGIGSSYGVYSYGPLGTSGGLNVTGSASIGSGLFVTGTKSFRIDHPDNPANQYLVHYSAESPEVINFYRGTVTLDSAGTATVELPPYFAKVNTSPSYTLTAVGSPMPMLHVSQEIDEAALAAAAQMEPDQTAPRSSFCIAGGAPGGKVSWRVDAVRNDRWVRANGAPVEVEKTGAERGTYLHPELYGQPPEKATHQPPAVVAAPPRRRPAPSPWMGVLPK